MFAHDVIIRMEIESKMEGELLAAEEILGALRS